MRAQRGAEIWAPSERWAADPSGPPYTSNASPTTPHSPLAAAAAVATAFVLLASGGPAVATDAGQTWRGPARVVDGDTLYIGETKFRLYGVDAPEKGQPCADGAGKSYSCGLVAKEALATKVNTAPVTCARKAKDQYGREVAVCSLGALDLNQWLVENGYAVAYKEYGKDYVPAEEAARSAKRGIWAGNFEYPAQWRKEERAGLPHPPLGGASSSQPLPPALAALATALGPPPQNAAASSGTCPDGSPAIKGNIGAKGDKIYHVPGGQYYDRVVVEVEKGEAYFCSEADAAKAGFRPVAGR